MPDEQSQPEAGLDATANATPPEQGSADIEQPGEGVPAGPEVAVDEYVKSLGLDYDDELNFELVSDEMLPQVQARLAQVNPQASRRKGLRYTDYHEKRQREAEEAKVVQTEKARLEQLAATTVPQYNTTQQPETGTSQPAPYTGTEYAESYTDPATAQLGQKVEQMGQYMQVMYNEMNMRAADQDIQATVRSHPDLTAPGEQEALADFMARSHITNAEQAYWAMKGETLVAQAKSEQETPTSAPQVPPSGGGPAKPQPPKTVEGALAGMVGFFKKHGVSRLSDLQ